MGLKKTIALLFTLCLLSGIFAGMPSSVRGESAPWTEGQGWGYRWIVNLSDFKEDIEKSWQRVDHLDMGGGASEMLYIKYLGKEGDTYIFEYFGGNYADMKLSISGKNASGIQRTLEYREKRDINYSGHIAVKESQYRLYAGASLHLYYGIKRVSANVSGKMDVHLKDIREKDTGTQTYEMEKKLNISYSDFRMEFSRPLPYVPAELSYWIFNEDLRVNYTGDRQGHISYSAHYPSGEDDSLDAHVGKHISGQESIYIHAVFFSNGTAHSPSILSISQIIDMAPYQGHLRDFEDYGFERNMWQKYRDGMITGIAQEADSLNYMVWSENATENEVNSYLSNKEAYTPGINAGTSDNSALYLVTGISIAVAILSIILLSRKKKS